MTDIVGTTTTMNNYLSKKDVVLVVQPEQPQEQKIFLPKKRIYTIPLFQRELRWNTGNVNVLLSDLSKGSRFLGNIILSLRTNNICEIIDGQQRTTIIRMIIECVRSKFGEEIELFDLCPIDNQSFPGFEKLASVCFDENKLTEDELREVTDGDVYNQLYRINHLWVTLKKSKILSNRHQAKSLIENLRESRVNIIASHSDAEDASIRHFLDVNLKGVQLDIEDIFKGHLFSQDSREKTRKLWIDNKRLAFELNTLKNGENEKRYPLMKIYEHFFYCDLYLPKANGQDFTNIKFGENFCLTAQFDTGINSFFEGTHIIEAICNSTYLNHALQRIKTSIKIMIDIVQNEGPSDNFKKSFKCPEKIDSVDISNCHIILQKILLDKAVIPKMLALKYILSFMDNEVHEKHEYKSIYSVFSAGVLFSVFANKKESESFYSIIRTNSWVDELNIWLYNYLSSHELTRGKLLAAYKYSEIDDLNSQQQVQCKSLAAIMNFIQVTNVKGKIILKLRNHKSFNTFLRDKTKFSVEHFIIGEKGTLKINTKKYKFNYSYPAAIKKYRNSLFNYIFIPYEINRSLENTLLNTKSDKVTANIDNIDCLYSRKYCGLLLEKKYFSTYPTKDMIDSLNTQEEVIEELNNYFTKHFPTDFLEFATSLIKSFEWNN